RSRGSVGASLNSVWASTRVTQTHSCVFYAPVRQKGTKMAHYGSPKPKKAAKMAKKADQKPKTNPEGPGGGGGRFAAMVNKLQGQATPPENPAAVAAVIGRRKYGASKMAKMAAKARK